MATFLAKLILKSYCKNIIQFIPIDTFSERLVLTCALEAYRHKSKDSLAKRLDIRRSQFQY